MDQTISRNALASVPQRWKNQFDLLDVDQIGRITNDELLDAP